MDPKNILATEVILNKFHDKIFAKLSCAYLTLLLEHAPFSPVRLMCGLGALCHQVLNKFFVAISTTNVLVPTSTRFFLRSTY